jgi:hypothetical protein
VSNAILQFATERPRPRPFRPQTDSYHAPTTGVETRGKVSDYDFEVLRTLRGRPTLRSLTASRSLGLISHSRPTLIAFKRLARIIFRTLFAVTPNRFAASAVLMIFMAQVYH